MASAWDSVDIACAGGVMLQPDLPLIALHRDLHGPDFFLYVVLHMHPIR